MSEAQATWWATELYPTKDAENFGLAGDFEVVRIEDVQSLRDERDRLRKALEDIRDSIGIGALNVNWIKQYAEAAVTPAGGGKK